jgi:hypothetical protein
MFRKTVLLFATLFFFTTSQGFDAHGGEVVPVGAGSYASEPPAYVDEGRQGDTVAQTVSRKLPIDHSQDGKPVPTNQWWTRFLIEPQNCTLWPYPLAVRPEPQGLQVFFPKEWNEIGTDMHLGPGVGLRAEAPAAATGSDGRADIVLADFEKGAFPMGWKAEGEAFGKGPAAGALDTQGPVEGFRGRFFVNSFHGGDAPTGTLASPNFRIDRRRLNFLLGGGADAANLGVRLLVGNVAVRTAASCVNQEKPEPVSWDVAEFAGKTGRIEIFDTATGSWGHVIADDFVLTDREQVEAGDGNSMAFGKMEALLWGDWSLTLRGSGPGSALVDYTLARGMPYCWAEYRGLDAVVETFGGCEILDEAGKSAVFPYRGKALVLSFGDRSFALHMTAGALCERDGTRLAVKFPKGAAGILALSPLPAGLSASVFGRAAMSPPRDTRLSWNYDPAAGRVATVWEISTDDPAAEVWQGWLPHHWNTAQKAKPAFADFEYATPRGRMRMAQGKRFEWDFPFKGFSPVVPAPTKAPFDADRMKAYLEGFAARTDNPPDTYWSGKLLLRMATAMNIAHECGHSDLAGQFQSRLRRMLENWFTYTPREREFFFAEYPRWKGLVGFRDSYGSHQFNDLHFHHGYFTVSSALLGLRDSEFLEKFGPMAELVAKGHANWDRTDTRFPFLRTLDVWEGHSNAAGWSGPNGNNQESSSEAVQSWAGLFLLGCAMENTPMRDTGAMGFAMERAATMQYWFDHPSWKSGPGASNWSPNYKHGTVGILFSAGQAFATYFSADPGWIYGIQWLPSNPTMDYLAMEPEFFKNLWERMWQERGSWLGGEAQRTGTAPVPNEIAAIEPPLANYLLGFQAGFDAAGAASTLEALWEAKNPVALDMNGAPFSYFQTHANLALGARQWDWTASVPTAAAHSDVAGNMTFTAVNFSAAPVEVSFSRNGTVQGRLAVPAHAVRSANELE